MINFFSLHRENININLFQTINTKHVANCSLVNKEKL